MDYPEVEKRLAKWGLLQNLEKASTTRLSEHGARIYVRAICGKKTNVRVKRVRGSWHYPHNGSITLACDKARTVRLLSVLHECAHSLHARGFAKNDAPHGESFCRTYARLLREAM